MDNQYTAQLLRRGRLLDKSHSFENKSQNFNILYILYIYQPNLLIIKKNIFIFKKRCFIVFIKASRKMICV